MNICSLQVFHIELSFEKMWIEKFRRMNKKRNHRQPVNLHNVNRQFNKKLVHEKNARKNYGNSSWKFFARWETISLWFFVWDSKWYALGRPTSEFSLISFFRENFNEIPRHASSFCSIHAWTVAYCIESQRAFSEKFASRVHRCCWLTLVAGTTDNLNGFITASFVCCMSSTSPRANNALCTLSVHQLVNFSTTRPHPAKFY